MRLIELEALDKDKLTAQQNLELYRHGMYNAFNKQVRLRSFEKGDLVLAIWAFISLAKRQQN